MMVAHFWRCHHVDYLDSRTDFVINFSLKDNIIYRLANNSIFEGHDVV